jgi:CRP/FNR family transcriptional regulator
MHLMSLVQEVAFERMDERLARFLLQEAEKMPGVYHPVEMSHEEFADHLGTAREVISRILEQFAQEGLIKMERRLVHIREPEGLRKWLRSSLE